MKKILLFTDILCSGGAQRQLVQLGNLLKQKGYEVLFLDYWDSKFYDEFLNNNGLAFNHVPTKGKINIIRMFAREVKLYKPDVVISYLENPSIVASIVHLFYKSKFKLIVSERNTTQSMNLATQIRFLLFKTVNYIVPNSQTQTSFILEKFPWLSNKTKMIRNYLDLDIFCPSLRPLPDNNRVIVVGRVVEQKNPIRFIEAIAKVASKGFSFTVDWYGNPHPMSFLADCNHKLKELGIERMFHFYPSTSNIVEKYHNASVFILPSIYEGFPNVLCEAMGCGLPVLASNVCDNGNILADGDNGFLFDPYNVDDISDKLIRFLSQSKDEKLRMGKRSRELAMELFSREKFIQAYMNLINS